MSWPLPVTGSVSAGDVGLVAGAPIPGAAVVVGLVGGDVDGAGEVTSAGAPLVVGAGWLAGVEVLVAEGCEVVVVWSAAGAVVDVDDVDVELGGELVEEVSGGAVVVVTVEGGADVAGVELVVGAAVVVVARCVVVVSWHGCCTPVGAYVGQSLAVMVTAHVCASVCDQVNVCV